MKIKIGNLPNSYLDAKFEDFLCTPNKYLQKRLRIFSNGRFSLFSSFCVVTYPNFWCIRFLASTSFIDLCSRLMHIFFQQLQK